MSAVDASSAEGVEAAAGVRTPAGDSAAAWTAAAQRSGDDEEQDAEPAIQAGRTIEDVERQLIEATLREAHGNRTKAAKLLGISRKSLYNKIKSYSIDA